MTINCVFCTSMNLEIVAENDLCYAIRDTHPVTDLHTLIISKPHHQTVFDLPPAVLLRMFALIKTCRSEILALDPTVKGFNFGANAGSAAGQRIHHVHFHLVPRRAGDSQPILAKRIDKVSRMYGLAESKTGVESTQESLLESSSILELPRSNKGG